MKRGRKAQHLTDTPGKGQPCCLNIGSSHFFSLLVFLKVVSRAGLPSLLSPWQKKDMLLVSTRGGAGRSRFFFSSQTLSRSGHILLFVFKVWNKLRVFVLLTWVIISTPVAYVSFYVKCMLLIFSCLLLRQSFPQRWIATKTFPLVHAAYCSWAGFQTMTK